MLFARPNRLLSELPNTGVQDRDYVKPIAGIFGKGVSKM